MWSFMICGPHQILSGVSNEIGGGCETYGGQKRRMQDFDRQT